MKGIAIIAGFIGITGVSVVIGFILGAVIAPLSCLFTPIIAVILFAATMYCTFDAYAQSLKINSGKKLGDWEFSSLGDISKAISGRK